MNREDIIIRKAKNLVTSAELVAIGSQTKIIDLFPQLKNASQIKYWTLFCTVSATFSAVMRSGLYIQNKELLNKTDEIVLENLREFNIDGVGAFEDLEKFIDDFLNNNPDKINDGELYALFTGKWIVWNLTSKKPIKDERTIAFVLGYLFCKGFVYYYKV